MLLILLVECVKESHVYGTPHSSPGAQSARRGSYDFVGRAAVSISRLIMRGDTLRESTRDDRIDRSV